MVSLVSIVSIADDEPLIPSDVQPEPVDEALIDDENIEIGIYGGILHIEDFESAPVIGVRVALHLSEGLFVEANYGSSELGDTSHERLNRTRLIPDEDRDYSYYTVGLGYNLFPGQAFNRLPFSTKTYAFNTNLYLSLGAGATNFAGDNRFTWKIGAGYQLLINDAVAFHVGLQEHIYKHDVFGEEKTNFDSELAGGVSVFF